MVSVIEQSTSSRSGESELVSDDRTLAVAVNTRPILEVALAKQKLTELKLVTAAEWDAAAAAAETDDQLLPILAQLQKMEAGWTHGGNERFPVLTAFQTQKILAGKPEELWLDHYVLLEKLGSGGMGDVFKARNTRLPRLEAIKTIQTDAAESDGVATLGLERFQREADLLAQLQHPNLTTIFHAGLDRDVRFIAIEYVRGRNLKEVVEEHSSFGRQMAVGTAVDYVMTVAEVLAHAHNHGVIHRDVKPANIMVNADGHLKVLDLGIAQLRAGKAARGRDAFQLTQGAVSLGTPDVMAPEQWADAQSVTPAADIYSLGCTLFYLLTGRMPFVASSREDLLCQVVSAPRPNATELRGDVPPELSAVIRRMLAHYPADRYQSGEEVIAALAPFANRATTVGVEKSSSHKFGLWAAAAGLVAAGAMALAIGWQKSAPQGAVDPTTIATAQKVNDALAHPFQDFRPPMTAAEMADKVAVDYENNSFAAVTQRLLALQSTPDIRDDNNLAVQVLVDGKPTDTILRGQEAQIRVRTQARGYLTMLVFTADGTQVRMHWAEPIEPGRWMTLMQVPAEKPGDDIVALFLTETDPWEAAPERPISLGYPQNFPDSPETAQGLLMSTYSAEDLDRFRSGFAYPDVYDSVMDYLRSGEPYPFDTVSTPPDHWWARQDVTLQVVDSPATKN